MLRKIKETVEAFKPKAEGHKPSVLSDLLCCPFCGDTDFDLVGLKGHLEHGDCKPYNELETIRRIF